MSLKLRVKARFPASVAAGPAIGITKANGIYAIALDVTGLQQVASVTGTDRATTYFPSYNANTGLYSSIAFSALSSNIGSNLFAVPLTPSQIAADQNDYAPTGIATASVLRLSTDASRNITGISASQGDGTFLVIENIGSNPVVLKNQSASSAAANRFQFEADVTMEANTAITLLYDGTASVWRSWGRVLSNTGVTAGSYGSASQVGTFTVDAHGRLSAAANVTLTSVNGLSVTASTGTLTVATLKTLTVNNSIGISGVDGKTLTLNNNLTLAGTDGTVQTFPSTSGTVVTSVTSHGVTNAMLSQAAAYTLKGNIAGSTGNVSDFTIGSLTQKVSPAGTDLVLIQDQAAGGALKYSPVSAVSAAGSVSSIAGNTGAFTLTGGITNDTNALVVQQAAPGGRLTLTSATPVTTTDVIGATVIYYAPCLSPFVPIYNGTVMRQYQFTSSATDTVGLSVTLGANWTLNTNYDWFIINDSGTIRLATGPAWTSDTARGTGAGTTELQMYNGLWTNKNSMTVRYANASTTTVAANQGTYVGTFRTVAAGQAEDSAAKRFLYNAYNQVQRLLKNVTETTTSWAYTSLTIRQANANTANQLDVVVGLAGAMIEANVYALGDTSAGGSFTTVGIGVDSTTVNSAITWTSSNSTNRGLISAQYKGYPTIGRHFYPWVEAAGVASGTNTYYGQSLTNNQWQSGISGSVLM